MRLLHVALCLPLLLLPSDVCGGRVKQALFGSFFGSDKKHTHTDGALADAEQAELVDMLRTHGFAQYAGKDFIEKLDEELAYDSIEDMTHIVADDEYSEVGMPHEDAVQIQKIARREMLKRFLESVPRPGGEVPELFAQHLDALIAAGYDEPDDVADLEEDEAKGMGISLEHSKILVSYAEEYETRLLLHLIITTLTDASGGMPYASEAKAQPLVSALVKAGIRSLADLAQITASEVPGAAAKDVTAVQNDPRVLRHAQKQELR